VVSVPSLTHRSRVEAANIHIAKAAFCEQYLRSKGMHVVMKKDLELQPEDIEDKDILIALGKQRPLTE